MAEQKDKSTPQTDTPEPPSAYGGRPALRGDTSDLGPFSETAYQAEGPLPQGAGITRWPDGTRTGTVSDEIADRLESDPGFAARSEFKHRERHPDWYPPAIVETVASVQPFEHRLHDQQREDMHARFAAEAHEAHFLQQRDERVARGEQRADMDDRDTVDSEPQSWRLTPEERKRRAETAAQDERHSNEPPSPAGAPRKSDAPAPL